MTDRGYWSPVTLRQRARLFIRGHVYRVHDRRFSIGFGLRSTVLGPRWYSFARTFVITLFGVTIDVTLWPLSESRFDRLRAEQLQKWGAS